MKENSIEMKQKVLSMLKDFMLGEEGKRFKPKAIEVEMIGKPELEDEGNEESEGSVLDKLADKMNAAKEGLSEKDWEGSDADEESDEEISKKPKMSLKDFLASH